LPPKEQCETNNLTELAETGVPEADKGPNRNSVCMAFKRLTETVNELDLIIAALWT